MRICSFSDCRSPQRILTFAPGLIYILFLKVISTIQPHDCPERFESLGVEVIFGEGEFKDENKFTVNGRDLQACAFVVSTSSRPKIPPIEVIEQASFLTNEQVFSQ